MIILHWPESLTLPVPDAQRTMERHQYGACQPLPFPLKTPFIAASDPFIPAPPPYFPPPFAPICWLELDQPSDAPQELFWSLFHSFHLDFLLAGSGSGSSNKR